MQGSRIVRRSVFTPLCEWHPSFSRPLKQVEFESSGGLDGANGQTLKAHEDGVVQRPMLSFLLAHDLFRES